MPVLADETSAVVGVIIVLVIPVTKGRIRAAEALIDRRLPLVFLRRRAHGHVGRGRRPGAPSPCLALAGDAQRLNHAYRDELVWGARPTPHSS